MKILDTEQIEEAYALNLIYDLYRLWAVWEQTAVSVSEFSDRVDDILKAQELWLVERCWPNENNNYVYVTKKWLGEIGKD